MFDLKKFLLDLLFPIQCLGCNQEGEWLCRKCLPEIEIDLKSQARSVGQGRNLDGVWITADYHQALLTKILHNFKYNFVSDLGDNLGELLTKFLARKATEGKISDFDLVVAVPLAKKRRLWRGFNQAEILARKVSQKFNWPLGLNIIFRQRHTHPQVGLKAIERIINIKGIFIVKDRNLVKHKKVLLIDDVITTGATMQECAKVLKQAGAKEVWGLVIAKG